MSILNQKPVFTINFHATGARYRLYLNGVLVERQGSSQGQNTYEIPVNHWMRSGKNTLDLTVYPNEEGEDIPPSSQIKALLQVRNFGEQENHSLGGFVFSGANYKDAVLDKAYQRDIEKFIPVEAGGITVSELGMIDDAPYDGARKYALTFEIPSNLPLWAFFESDDVPDLDVISDKEYDEVSDELYMVLSNLQNHLEQGKVDDIMPLFAERNRETDLAFYKEEGQTERELHSDFTNDIPTLSMINLGQMSTGYESEINLKLASNFRNGRKNAISGNLKSGPGNLSFPIMFRKEDGKWIITR
ncbi:MAG: hypothetical protein KBT81_01670 [Oleispira antarctica]|nr:hypothetical protein [Oleispira antarctica]